MFLGTQVNQEKDESSNVGISDSRVDIIKIIGDDKGLIELIKNPTTTLKNIFSNIVSEFSPDKYLNATKSLNEEAYRLARTLGVSSAKTRELSVSVADAIPEFVGIGLEVKDAGLAMSNLFDALNTNLSIGKDVLVDFAATSKVTGVEQKTLATSFRDVGVGIASVGKNMLEVVNIARQAGVTVSAVSTAVVGNLDKMNLYNFEGGIKGLAKMAAQATRLGTSLEGVFGIVDKVFNPEGAIGLAAALQRLGVTTSDLLDPLRLMDLAQNDPTELQNQVVNMTKEFVRFNKEANQFEILPGAKRRLNEIGKELGYNNGELQKMALNAANFDYKLQKIRMPDLPVNEDTRNLIATMAQINDKGIAEIRVAKVDPTTGELTGKYDTVDVRNLTEQQIKIIQRQNAEEAKSMEAVAKDQLDELRKLNSVLNEFVMAQRYGIASSNTMYGGYENVLRGTTGGVKNLLPEKTRQSEFYRENFEQIFGGKSFGDIFKMTTEGLQKLVKKGIEKIGEIDFGNIQTQLTDTLKNNLKNVPLPNITDLFSQTTFNQNVNHSGTVTNKIEIIHNWENYAQVNPMVREAAETAINKMIGTTEFQASFKDAKKLVFDKNIEPTNIKEGTTS
jgi:hypothetical protein